MSKPFTLQLAELNEGSTASALTNDFAELLATVQRTGRSGSLDVKIKVAPATKSQAGSVDKVTITVDRKVTLPKAEAASDFFFLTDDAELTRQHPKQQSLELRDVTSNPPLSTEQLRSAQ